MMNRAAIALLVGIGSASCAAVVDTDDLGDISDYESWHQFEVRGALPAHGDTIRVVYANDISRSWSGAGEYPIGSTIIKEIYNRDGDERGSLSYIAIMRKLDEESVPSGGELQEGWLFTILGDIDSPEKNNLRCYNSCHVAAPYDLLFHDFGAE